MKKGLAILMAAGLLAVSGTSVYAEDTEEEEIITEEGYTEEGDGYTSVISWTSNEDKNIYGQFFYPEDFDESQQYPVIIMSHGFRGSHEDFEDAGWVQLFSQTGYVCYTYDFCGGAPKSLSDGDFSSDMSVMTEVSDLEAVMEFVEGKSFCDPENLYLMGQSQGGLVTGLTGAKHSDEVAGMILLFPALSIPDNIREAYPTKEDIPDEGVEQLGAELGKCYAEDVYDLDVWEELSGYEGDVLLMHGMNDSLVPYTLSVKALEECYTESASELLLVQGKMAVHGFDTMYPEGQEYAHGAALDFLSSHIYGQEAEN
ncbi:MAG: alpha/beta fold hydrolase [Clostridiales bacterium]|nr:alpha/beta fold hydrolase [Clostridiales bacterium]